MNRIHQMELKVQVNEGFPHANIAPKVAIDVSMDGEAGGTLSFSARQAAWFLAFAEGVAERFPGSLGITCQYADATTKRSIAEMYLGELMGGNHDVQS